MSQPHVDCEDYEDYAELVDQVMLGKQGEDFCRAVLSDSRADACRIAGEWGMGAVPTPAIEACVDQLLARVRPVPETAPPRPFAEVQELMSGNSLFVSEVSEMMRAGQAARAELTLVMDASGRATRSEISAMTTWLMARFHGGPIDLVEVDKNSIACACAGDDLDDEGTRGEVAVFRYRDRVFATTPYRLDVDGQARVHSESTWVDLDQVDQAWRLVPRTGVAQPMPPAPTPPKAPTLPRRADCSRREGRGQTLSALERYVLNNEPDPVEVGWRQWRRELRAVLAEASKD